MSILEESIKKKENILSNQIKKELNLLPRILRQKKKEVDNTSKEIVLIKEKSIFLDKELENLVFNITSLEKELTSVIIKNDTIKSHQKIILNSINNEMPFNFNQYLKNKDKLKELMLLFLNCENDYSKELTLILDNNNELTSLLIGSYSYLKMLNNDFPQKYQQKKDIIYNKLIEVKELDNNNLFCLIINYIENIFKLLDNKAKINILEQKIESFNQKKNEIFIKLKIFEEKNKEKENYSNIINNYINELISIIEKYKLLMRCSNTKLINSLREKKNKKIGNYSGAKLNISCPNNALSQKDNEIRNTNNKISYINIDLTNIEKDNNINKKTIDTVDDDSKINKSNSNYNRNNISNYNNVKDLEKDIYEQFEQLKSNPLYSIKKNNNNTNIILNNKNKISKNKVLKKHNTKNIDTTKKKNLLNKSNKKQIIDNNNIDNNIVINQTNTTMTCNNIIINNNNNEINKFNLSYDSNKKNLKIKNNTSSRYINKNSPFKKDEKNIAQNQIHKPGKMKLIPYLTQDYQFNKDQRKSNESYIRRKTNNKESNNFAKARSPLYSPHKTKKIININNSNYKNISPNLDNINCNTDQMGDKVNQSSYSKVSQKNIYNSIKHNKTNLCKDQLIGKHNYNKRSQKSVNKITFNICKKDKNVNSSKIEKKKSPNKQSSSFLLNILNNEENNNKNLLNEKQKNKKITKININLDKYKNKSPILKQRQFCDKKNKDIEQNDKDKEINGNEIYSKNMDNSLKNNNINKNYNIIPFKKNKNKQTNINYGLDKKNNSNNIKCNKTPKTNNNYKNDRNAEINNSEIKFNNNSQIVNNLIKKEINNYSFNKQDKNHKKSYFKI